MPAGSLAVITMRDERQWSDHCLENLAALLQPDGGVRLGARERHIGHRDRSLERGRKAPARDPADLIALAVQHQRAFAHRLTSFDQQADALLHRPLLALDTDTVGARKAAFLAPPLGNRETEIGH